VKNGFTDSLTAGGYRDIKLNVEVDGHVCEIQLHLKQFYSLKNEKGHDLYNKIRTFKIEGALDASDLIVGMPHEFLESLDCILEMEYASAKMKEPQVWKNPLPQKDFELVLQALLAERNRICNGQVHDADVQLKSVLAKYFLLYLYKPGVVEDQKDGFDLNHSIFTDAEFLDVLHDLAKAYADKGLFERSAGYYAVVLVKKQSLFGHKHPAYLSARRDYARLMKSADVPNYVLQEYLHATLESYKITLGVKSLETLRCQSDLAAVFNKRSEQLNVHLDILKTKMTVLGENSFHLEMANSYRYLADLYRGELKEPEKRIDNLKQCLAIEQQLLGERNVRTLCTRLDLIWESHQMYCSEADEMLELLKNVDERLFVDVVFRRIFFDMKNPKLAEYYLKDLQAAVKIVQDFVANKEDMTHFRRNFYKGKLMQWFSLLSIPVEFDEKVMVLLIASVLLFNSYVRVCNISSEGNSMITSMLDIIVGSCTDLKKFKQMAARNGEYAHLLKEIMRNLDPERINPAESNEQLGLVSVSPETMNLAKDSLFAIFDSCKYMFDPSLTREEMFIGFAARFATSIPADPSIWSDKAKPGVVTKENLRR
jgi:hypothetical protein